MYTIKVDHPVNKLGLDIRTANTVIAKVIMYTTNTRLKYHCVVNNATTQNHSKLGLRCVKSLITMLHDNNVLFTNLPVEGTAVAAQMEHFRVHILEAVPSENT